MYPKLSDIINKLIGSDFDLPIQTFGFFLVSAFLAAWIFLRMELIIKENAALLPVYKKRIKQSDPPDFFDIIVSFIFSAFIGYKLFGLFFKYAEFWEHPFDYIFNGNGHLSGAIIFGAISLGINISALLRGMKKPFVYVQTHPFQMALPIISAAFIFGLLGAKSAYILLHLKEFKAFPFQMILSFDMIFWGGLILATLVIVGMVIKSKVDWRHFSDSSVLAISMGLAFGNLGCYLSGDAGLMSSTSGIYSESLYKSAFFFIIFSIFMALRKNFTIPGLLFSTFLIIAGLGNYIIETTGNFSHRPFIIDFSSAIYLPLFLFLTGLFLSAYFLINYFLTKKKNTGN